MKKENSTMDLWAEVQLEVSKLIPKSSFETWILPATGKITDENVFVVKAANDFSRDWIVERYEKLIRNILKEITGQEINIVVTSPVNALDKYLDMDIENVVEDSQDEKSGDKEKKFRAYIKWMRLKRGFTLSQVADRLGISTNYVSQLERGERKVTDELVVNFAELYNIDEDVLFWMSGNIPLKVRELILNDRNLQEALSCLHKSRQ
ncbi:helix-turn-helix domain-containing protein [Virgibacillus sp. SK37]|uniref:helix-turn-helix domain-containing protein n=1 Tax=Virgibacillus sp. SK37 TaxID=403957 RepID=UPI0004D170E7|nr:helix-turn-helix transcriptional regulator [Virgibacillus sp. SK37]AIF45087.1 hypothetical protein X953_01395 [Virgibacillus sp. SK37]